jgi:hypothetical protein
LRSYYRRELKVERRGAEPEAPEDEPDPDRERPATTARRPREEQEAELLESGDIPRPETRAEEAYHYAQALEESRDSSMRRRIERETPGGASGSREGPRVTTEGPADNPPSEGSGEVAKVARLKARTAKWEDPRLIEAWERYDHMKELRARAYREEDFRSSAYIHTDMNDLIERIEQREAELQEEELDRRYAPPPVRGKGSKGGGKPSSALNVAPKKARTWY